MSAATKKIAAIDHSSNGVIKTRRVSNERMSAAARLEFLKFDSTYPVITCENGLLLKLKNATESYVVFYFYGESLNERQTDFLSRYSSRRLDINDDHFFFLVKELNIPLLGFVDSNYLQNKIHEGRNGTKEMDFDEVVNCHGKFISWNVDGGTSVYDFLELLISDENGCRIGFSDSSHDYFLPTKNNAESELRVISLGKLSQDIIKPIELAIDKKITSANIRLNDASYLCDALKEFEVSQNGLVFGVGGGVCFGFKRGDDNYVALSFRNLQAHEVSKALNALVEIGVDEVNYSESHFISFLLSHNKYLDLRREKLANPIQIENELNIGDTLDASLEDISDFYEDIRVFSLRQSSSNSPWIILCNLAVRVKSARSPFIPDEIIEVANRLLIYKNIPYENIYLSLSASHWKHAFIEAYRIIEELYYFGWMHSIKNSLNIIKSEFDLFNDLQSNISWKYKEQASIAKLFQTVPRDVLEECDPLKIESIKEKFTDFDNDAVMSKFAHLVYSIRNSNVHQGEKSDEPSIKVSAECWPKITMCLYLIIEHMYKCHASGMPRLDEFTENL